MDEPNEAKDFDQIADEVYENQNPEKETPADTSSENKPVDEDPETDKTPTAEVDKTEQVKAVEEDTSLSVEDKIDKVKEILGDDIDAIDAYVKEKGYHTDPAWIKQREIIDRQKKDLDAKIGLSDEDKQELANFKEITSSAEYITASMKSQGYTQEAIDKSLKVKGFDVQAKPDDDLQFISKKLNIDPATLSEQQKFLLEDVSKVVNILLEERLSKVLPEQLKPIKEHLGGVEQANSAERMTAAMKSVLKAEGVLDFEQDIEPEINKYLDKNPDATQQDVHAEFERLNHKLSIERLRTGKRKETRDKKKENLRQNFHSAGRNKNLPKKTGNFEKDADSFFDSVNAGE